MPRVGVREHHYWSWRYWARLSYELLQQRTLASTEVGLYDDDRDDDYDSDDDDDDGDDDDLSDDGDDDSDDDSDDNDSDD